MPEQACNFKEGDLVVVKPEYSAVVYEAYDQPTFYSAAKCQLGKRIALGEPALVLYIWDDEMWITDQEDTAPEFLAPLTKWFKFYKAVDPIDHLL